MKSMLLRVTLAAVAVIFILAPIAFCVGGCAPAKPAEPPLRASMRSAIVAAAYGVKAAGDICEKAAFAVLHRGDKPGALRIAKQCDDGYEGSRQALLAAESAMDAWDDASEKKLACAARDAYVALSGLRNAILMFEPIPAPVDDGLEMARWASNLAGGVCTVGAH